MCIVVAFPMRMCNMTSGQLSNKIYTITNNHTFFENWLETFIKRETKRIQKKKNKEKV